MSVHPSQDLFPNSGEKRAYAFDVFKHKRSQYKHEIANRKRHSLEDGGVERRLCREDAPRSLDRAELYSLSKGARYKDFDDKQSNETFKKMTLEFGTECGRIHYCLVLVLPRFPVKHIGLGRGSSCIHEG